MRHSGKAWPSPLLVVSTLPNGTGESRFGYVVSGRVGKAVVRNRVRRRLKEIVRQESVHAGWDVVLTARTSIVKASFSEVRLAVQEALRRSRIQIMAERPEPNGIKGH